MHSIRRLLCKLEVGELKRTLKNWMEDYLKGRNMRTVVKDEKSEWRKVKIGVPQGSGLELIMCSLCVNNMTEGVSSYINLFVDDAKLLKKIKSHKDCEEVENHLNKIYE